MSSKETLLNELIQYVQAERRICPNPQQWNELWHLLPKAPEGIEKPGPPLILAAWWVATPLMKMIRLREHIVYADTTNVLIEVDGFLRALDKDAWDYLP